jgi:hypothetical protein
VENLKASGIRKAAAGIEPLSRCDVQSVVLSSVSVQYKRTKTIHMRKPVAYHINPLKTKRRLLYLTLSEPMSDLVRQYDFPVPLRCRKTSDTVFVAFVRPLSEPVRRFSSFSTDFAQQIAQVVLFLFLYVFLF